MFAQFLARTVAARQAAVRSKASTPGRTNPRRTRPFCSQTRHNISIDCGSISQAPSSRSVPARNCLRPAFLAQVAQYIVSSNLGPALPLGAPRLGRLPRWNILKGACCGRHGTGLPGNSHPALSWQGLKYRVLDLGWAGCIRCCVRRLVPLNCCQTFSGHESSDSTVQARRNPPQPRDATSQPLQIHLKSRFHLWRIRCGGRRWEGSPCLTDSKISPHWILRFEPAAAAPEHWIRFVVLPAQPFKSTTWHRTEAAHTAHLNQVDT